MRRLASYLDAQHGISGKEPLMAAPEAKRLIRESGLQNLKRGRLDRLFRI